MPEESLEFVRNRGDGIVAFKLYFVLLLVEINPISEKRGCKRDAFVTCGSSRVKIILILLTKVIALYRRAFIVKIRVSSLKKAIVGCNTCLKVAMFLAFNKQF